MAPRSAKQTHGMKTNLLVNICGKNTAIVQNRKGVKMHERIQDFWLIMPGRHKRGNGGVVIRTTRDKSECVQWHSKCSDHRKQIVRGKPHRRIVIEVLGVKV